MKVSVTVKGYEPYKWSKKDIEKWLVEILEDCLVFSKDEAKEAAVFDNVHVFLKQPKRMTLTIAYWREDA